MEYVKAQVYADSDVLELRFTVAYRDRHERKFSYGAYAAKFWPASGALRVYNRAYADHRHYFAAKVAIDRQPKSTHCTKHAIVSAFLDLAHKNQFAEFDAYLMDLGREVRVQVAVMLDESNRVPLLYLKDYLSTASVRLCISVPVCEVAMLREAFPSFSTLEVVGA